MNNLEKLTKLFGEEKGEKIAKVLRVAIKIEGEEGLGESIEEQTEKVAKANGYELEPSVKTASLIEETETYKTLLREFDEEDANFICESIRKIARFKAAGLRRGPDYLERLESELDEKLESK